MPGKEGQLGRDQQHMGQEGGLGSMVQSMVALDLKICVSAPAVQMSLLWPRGKHCRGPANVHGPVPSACWTICSRRPGFLHHLFKAEHLLADAASYQQAFAKRSADELPQVGSECEYGKV